jgi:hypothetical protein
VEISEVHLLKVITTINVSEFSSGYKVRAVFQKKVLNNRGEITSIENIKVYSYKKN